MGELKGHTSWVKSIAWHPDGKRLASGSLDQTVRLWEVGSQSCVGELTGHTDTGYSIAWHPDGKRLASGSWDCSILIWTRIGVGFEKTEKWILTGRLANAFSLSAQNTFLKGAKISQANLALLKQNGANEDDRPSLSKNTYSFWSKDIAETPAFLEADAEKRPKKSLQKSVVDPFISFNAPDASEVNVPKIYRKPLLAPVPQPLIQALTVISTNDAVDPNVSGKVFGKTVVACTKALQEEIDRSKQQFDDSAAASFVATFLRCLRKDMLTDLKKSPEDFGIPMSIMPFFNLWLEKNPMLKQASELAVQSRAIEETLLRGELQALVAQYCEEENLSQRQNSGEPEKKAKEEICRLQ